MEQTTTKNTSSSECVDTYVNCKYLIHSSTEICKNPSTADQCRLSCNICKNPSGKVFFQFNTQNRRVLRKINSQKLMEMWVIHLT